MKANKRIRDLGRRNHTGIRRYSEVAGVYVTASMWTRDEKGNRVRNWAITILEPGEKPGRSRL